MIATPVIRPNAVASRYAAAGRAAELSQQMLAYSGRGRFDVRTLDLSQLVEEMVHLLESVAPEVRISGDPNDLPGHRLGALDVDYAKYLRRPGADWPAGLHADA